MFVTQSAYCMQEAIPGHAASVFVALHHENLNGLTLIEQMLHCPGRFRYPHNPAVGHLEDPLGLAVRVPQPYRRITG